MKKPIEKYLEQIKSSSIIPYIQRFTNEYFYGLRKYVELKGSRPDKLKYTNELFEKSDCYDWGMPIIDYFIEETFLEDNANRLKVIISNLTPNRIIFGSDFPIDMPIKTIEKMKEDSLIYTFDGITTFGYLDFRNVNNLDKFSKFLAYQRLIDHYTPQVERDYKHYVLTKRTPLTEFFFSDFSKKENFETDKNKFNSKYERFKNLILKIDSIDERNELINDTFDGLNRLVKDNSTTNYKDFFKGLKERVLQLKQPETIDNKVQIIETTYKKLFEFLRIKHIDPLFEFEKFDELMRNKEINSNSRCAWIESDADAFRFAQYFDFDKKQMNKCFTFKKRDGLKKDFHGNFKPETNTKTELSKFLSTYSEK